VSWLITLLMFAACSTAVEDRPTAADGDGPPATEQDGSSTAGGGSPEAAAEPVAERVTGSDQVAAAEEGSGEGAPPLVCLRPEGMLAADGSLEGRVGEYRLTMVEEIDGSPSRRAEGSLTLVTQAEPLRRFAGSAGDAIPGVTSPLFGGTDVNIEAVGAVRVGSLSSQDPASPGVLVIESETGTGPSILLRLGSDANRRDIVRFDGGYTVLRVVAITTESFSGTWSSGARGPDSEGFFCATQSR